MTRGPHGTHVLTSRHSRLLSVTSQNNPTGPVPQKAGANMAEKKPAVVAEDTASDAALKSSLYGKALTALKVAHKDEFDSTLAGLYAEKGLTYTPRLTPQERKLKELKALAAELGVTITANDGVEAVA